MQKIHRLDAFRRRTHNLPEAAVIGVRATQAVKLTRGDSGQYTPS